MAKFLNKIGDIVFGPADDGDDDDFLIDTTPEPEVPKAVFGKKTAKVVNINTTTQLSVVILQPEKFEEVKEVADHLKTKRTVLVNLEPIEKEIAKRIVDFISGTVYALDGSIQKVSNNIFIVAPYNVNILNDLKDELRNKGVFPWSY